jgi:hypothetical protein
MVSLSVVGAGQKSDNANDNGRVELLVVLLLCIQNRFEEVLAMKN